MTTRICWKPIVMGTLFALFVCGGSIWAQPAPPAAVVSAGYDLFTTDPSTTDLLGIPFVGDTSAKPTFDFVAPPASAAHRRAIGDTDSIVHRLQDASVTAIPGTASPIAIELVALRLVSTVDFDVDGDGTMDGPVYVTLQKDRDPSGETRFDYDAMDVEHEVFPGLRSFGIMTINFASADGGTFNSALIVYADLRIGSADGPIVCGETAGLPPCVDFDAGLSLESTDAFWGRSAVPDSITIRGVNYSLAAPDANTPVDDSIDFWAGVDPDSSTTICVEHGGHPDPAGLPTRHGTCVTSCTTEPIMPNSCANGEDDDCNGTIDDCAEDLFGPVVQAPPTRTYECPNPDVGPDVTGFATATDNCFPPNLPASSITYEDFVMPGCGQTFSVDRVWTATDGCGNVASMPDLQQIFVVDTTPPDIDCPDSRIILWTADRSPDALGYATGADVCSDVEIDWMDVSVPGICLSEEITRTWTATDDCGLETPCDQPISVRGPKDAIEDLEDVVLTLGLPRGIENSLVASLEAAAASACRGNATSAVNQLESFISKVETQQRAGRIDAADAARLISDALAIIAAIDEGGVCPDGCEDDDDDETCSDSDTSPTVVIDGCDSGVINITIDNGCTVSDEIAECAENATNHGDFVSCVAALLNDLRDAGLISGRDRGAIQRCAAQADLP